jgi:hypothetical protein
VRRGFGWRRAEFHDGQCCGEGWRAVFADVVRCGRVDGIDE